MPNFISYNGNFYDRAENIINAGDHSYRYGDGLFETMKIKKGDIQFEEYHFERLFSGLDFLKFKYSKNFTRQKLIEEIKELCKKNKFSDLVRVRLSVSRGNGGLYDCDDNISYVVECWPLEEKSFNENSLTIDIFPHGRKAIDDFSNLKSANYLTYVMAAIWAKENKLNDAFILNSNGRICEATIANVFWVKGGRIFTPPLTEGCVAGVMRRKLIESNLDVSESILTENILLEADEVFLTNVVTGLRWAKQFRDKKYNNTIASRLFANIEQTISI